MKVQVIRIQSSAFILPPSSFRSGCGGRIRTFGERINNALPYQLGYATKDRDEVGRMKDENSGESEIQSSALILPPSSVQSGGDEGSRTLIVRFTRPTLCYPVELHRLNW
jgi:hypothetical protein